MKKRHCTVLGMLMFSAICANASAQEEAPGVAASIKAGTLGAGLELDYAFNANWNIRLQAHAFNYDDDLEEDDIEYNGEIDLSSYGVLVDWRPFSGVFKLSGGYYINGNKITAKANSSQNSEFDIGDEIYVASGSNPLTLDANIDLGNSSAGYLGLGWGNLLFDFIRKPQLADGLDARGAGIGFVDELLHPLRLIAHQQR